VGMTPNILLYVANGGKLNSFHDLGGRSGVQ
jgi:hypothetical protein